MRELIENARVIGGIDPASSEAGRALYATFVRGDIILTDATTAEMVKLMENTYRDVNIAIANEFSRLADRFGKISAQKADRVYFDATLNSMSDGTIHIHVTGNDQYRLIDTGACK